MVRTSYWLSARNSQKQMGTEEKKKTNWTGIAAFVAAMAAVPGVLVNTYLDFKSRNTTELVQKSSYENLATNVEEINGDVKECFGEVGKLKLELAELKGYLRGMRRGGGRVPAALAPSAPPEEESDSGEEKSDKKPRAASRKPASFDSIMQHVQSTGKPYVQSQDQEQQ